MGFFSKPADAATIGETYTVVSASDFNHRAQYLSTPPRVKDGDVLQCKEKRGGHFDFEIVSRVDGEVPENPIIPTSHAADRKHHPSTYGLQHLAKS